MREQVTTSLEKGDQRLMTSLSGSQKRGVLCSFLDIHRRMAEMEAVLAQGGKSSAFAQYTHDLSPTESKVVHDYFTRFRAAMLDCLRESDIPLEVRRTSVRWTLQCAMTFIDIAISEFSPERLRGYGPVDSAAGEQVIRTQQKLRRLVERVASYLRQGLGSDLSERLAHLDASRVTIGILPLLERAITRWGLVEFRPQLDLIT